MNRLSEEELLTISDNGNESEFSNGGLESSNGGLPETKSGAFRGSSDAKLHKKFGSSKLLAENLAKYIEENTKSDTLKVNSFTKDLVVAMTGSTSIFDSDYISINNNGEKLRIRLSDHSGNALSIITKGGKADKGYSFVVKYEGMPDKKRNKKFQKKAKRNLYVVEYVYDNPSQERMVNITKGIFNLLDTGEYVDIADADLITPTPYAEKVKRDEEYLNAVESGNERQARQTMLDYAKEKGYEYETFHGSKHAGFRVIDMSKSDDGRSFFSSETPSTAMTYTTEPEEVGTREPKVEDFYEAEHLLEDYDLQPAQLNNGHYVMVDYSKNEKGEVINDFGDDEQALVDHVNDLIAKGEYGIIDRPGIMSLLLKFDNPLRINARGNNWDAIPASEISGRAEIMIRPKDAMNPDGEVEIQVNKEPTWENGDWNWNEQEEGEVQTFANESAAYEYVKNTYGDGLMKKMRDAYMNTDWTDGKHDSTWKYEAFSIDKETGKESEGKSTRDIAREAYDAGYDGVIIENVIDNGGNADHLMVDILEPETVYISFKPNQVKSAETVTYDDAGNIIPLSERFNSETDDIRFSLDIQNTDPFYSNAAKAVEGIRQEKATPEQWLKMIEKSGGLKKGEDKWMGLSEWLKQKTAEGVISGKKTITKQEVMDYISNNAIKLEDVNYIDSENIRREGLARMREEFEQTKKAIQEEGNGMSVEEAQKAWDDFSNEMYDKYGGAFMLHLTDEEKKRNDELKEATKHAKREYESWELADEAFSRMIGKYGSDFDDGFYVQGGKLYLNADDRTDTVRDSALRVMGYDNIKPINDTRMAYTTAGLKDNKEIALTVPTIEPYNEKDGIHFGDAGEGRAVAWIRFGDAESVSKTDGHRSRVLVIDEIQSKRHQDGREEGYDTDYKESPKYKYNHARLEMSNYRADMVAKYGEYFMKEDMTPEEQKKYQELYDAMEEASNYNSESVPLYNVPDAPFRKNWHELAMKRMLRYAAENGYDKVAWTTGEQQAERYDIGGVVPYINIKTDLHPAVDERARWKTLRFEANGNACRVDINTDGKVILAEGIGNDAEGKSVNEVFGKEVGDQIMQSQADDRIILEGKHIGGEGMKGFYDQILPKFMQKYGKKWGAKVGEVELNLPNEADRKMWSVDVTPEMKESVMEGQAMFSVPKKYNEKKELLKERYKDTSTEDLFVSLHKNGETDYDKVTEITRRVKEEGVRLYRQGKEASGRGNTELCIAGQIICRGARCLSRRDIWRKDATTRLIEWAEDNGYFNEDPRHFLKDYEEEPFAQATESKVYKSNDRQTVRKIWSYAELFKYGEKPTTIDEAIDNVMWSNQVFPNDQTKLVGMTYNEYGDAAFIVEQDFAGKPLSKIIKSNEERQKEIDKIMLSVFEAVRVDKNDDVFDAEDFRYEDAHGGNITRDDEGYYRFIDIKVVPKFEGPDIELKDNPDDPAMFSLNKPVRRRGETDVEYMKRLFFWDARKQEGERMLNAQKVVEDQIKHLMDNKLIGATQKSQLSSMLSSLRNATDSNLYDQIKKVERTVREVEANVLSKEIADALSLKIQDLNGRNMKIAKNVDNQTRQVIGNVKDRMKGLAETDEDKNIKKIGSDLWYLRDENRRLQAEVDSARSKGFPYEVDSVEYNNAIVKIQENEASIAQMSQQVKDLKAARDKEVRAQIEWGGRDVQTQLDELMQKMDEAVDPDSPEKWTEEDQVKWVTLDVLKDRVELEKLYQDLYDAREKRSNATTTAERRAWDLQCENIEIERQQKLRAFNEKIKTLVEGGKESLAAQKQAEIQHRLDLIRGMMSDIRGERGKKMPSEPSEAQDRSKRKGFKEFMEGAFTSTLKSFEYMAHVIDRNHFSRDGWFFKYFMKSKNGVMAAQNNYLKNYEQSMQTLTDATEKIFGKKATDVAKEGMEQNSR